MSEHGITPPLPDEQAWRLHRLDEAARRRLDAALPRLDLAAVATAMSRELLETPEMRLLVEDAESLRQFQNHVERYAAVALETAPAEALRPRWRELGAAAQGLGLSPGFLALAAHRLLIHLSRGGPELLPDLAAVVFPALDALLDGHQRAALETADTARLQAERYAASLEDALAERDRRLRAISPNDPLTGLLTPARFQDELTRTLGLSRRRGEPFTLIHLAAQGIKECLERDGRAGLDEALFLLALTLRETFRKTDLLCRLEEGVFLVAMPNATEKQAVEITNRMIRVFTGQEHRGVTFILGIAQTGPDHHAAAEALREQAATAAGLVLPLAQERPGFYVRRAGGG